MVHFYILYCLWLYFSSVIRQICVSFCGTENIDKYQSVRFLRLAHSNIIQIIANPARKRRHSAESTPKVSAFGVLKCPVLFIIFNVFHKVAYGFD